MPQDNGKPTNGVSHPEDPPDDEGSAEPTGDAPKGTRAPTTLAPEPVHELSAACERFVLTKYDVRLDKTKDTLSVLDHYVRDARAEVQAKAESLPLLQAAIGAYFGEVVRREFDAEWFCQGDHDGWRLDFVHVFLTFNPLGMAREALLLEESDGWHAHLEMDEEERGEVDRRLSRLPEVDDEQFYLPTTRFEVLEIAVDAIRAQMQERGLGDVIFGPKDYRK